MKKSGFTLIELLVVIAIIGILATVILISLGIARDKSKNVRVLSSVRQIRSTLESNYLNSAYADLVPAGGNLASINTTGPGSTDLLTLITDVGNLNGHTNAVTISTNSDLFTDGQVGGTGADTGVVIFTTNTSGAIASDYAIYATTTAGYVCIDSVGHVQSQGGGTITSPPLDANSKVICQ